MSVYIHLIGATPLKLWGLSSSERLQRLLQQEGITNFVDDLNLLPTQSSVLLLRGDCLYHNRILQQLVHKKDVVLQAADTDQDEIAAAHVPAALAAQARNWLQGRSEAEIPTSLQRMTLSELSSGYEAKLLKSDTPFVLPITTENRTQLEHRLFSGAYKGVTDLVTKWVWPRPAQWATRVCVHLGARPNHVTSISWLLAILTIVLFAQGLYGWGLVTGWLMTFLDTVDGKLARVTVTYTRFGDRFDHILDLIHPPIWYLAWGLGLNTYATGILGLSLSSTFWVIFLGYIGGRLAEGLFKGWIGKFSIFTWRPIDSYSRLITARRNPCLILLTLGALFGRPDLGLTAVTVWIVASTLFLLLRLVMAIVMKTTGGTLQPWLMEIGDTVRNNSPAVRWFSH